MDKKVKYWRDYKRDLFDLGFFALGIIGMILAGHIPKDWFVEATIFNCGLVFIPIVDYIIRSEARSAVREYEDTKRYINFQDKHENVLTYLCDEIIPTISKRDVVYCTSTVYPGDEYEERLMAQLQSIHESAPQRADVFFTRIISNCNSEKNKKWLAAIRDPQNAVYAPLRELNRLGKAKIFCHDDPVGLDILLISNNSSRRAVLGIKEAHIEEYSGIDEPQNSFEARGQTYYFDKNSDMADSLFHYITTFLLHSGTPKEVEL